MCGKVLSEQHHHYASQSNHLKKFSTIMFNLQRYSYLPPGHGGSSCGQSNYEKFNFFINKNLEVNVQSTSFDKKKS